MAIYIPPGNEEFTQNIQLMINLRQLDEDISKNHMLKANMFRDIGDANRATEEMNKSLGRGAISDMLADTAVGKFLGMEKKLTPAQLFAAEPEPEKGASEEYIKQMGEGISELGQTSIKQQQKAVGESRERWEQQFKRGELAPTQMQPLSEPMAKEEIAKLPKNIQQYIGTKTPTLKWGGKETYKDTSAAPDSAWNRFVRKAEEKRAAHKAWEGADWAAQTQYKKAFDEYQNSNRSADSYNKMQLKMQTIDEKFGWDVWSKMKMAAPPDAGAAGKGDYIATRFNADTGQNEYRMISAGERDLYQDNGFIVDRAGTTATPPLTDVIEKRKEAANKIYESFLAETSGILNLTKRESTIAKEKNEALASLGHEIVEDENGEWKLKPKKGFGLYTVAKALKPGSAAAKPSGRVDKLLGK